MRVVTYTFLVLGFSIYYSSFLPISTDHPYLSNSNDTMVVFNPIIQTSLGKAVNFNIYSFYGDYALILSPIFKFVSPSVENITLVLGAINFVSLVLYGRIIALVNSTPIPSVCFFMLGIFLQYHAFTIWPADKYYQVYPIRMLFPIVTIWLILEVLPTRPMVFFLISPAISALAIIWNFETGVVCLISLLVANVLCKSLDLKVYQRFIFFLLTLSSSLTIYLLSGYFKTGNEFQIRLFTKPFGIWYVKLESIRWNGFWLMVLFFYLLALATTVKNHKRGKDSSSYIACLVMSIGLLFYHLLNYIQHESTLSNVAWPIPIALLIALRFRADGRHEVDFSRNYGATVLMLISLAFGISSLIYVNFNGYISIEPKDYEIRNKTKVRELYRTYVPERGAFYITNVEQAAGQLSPWQRRALLARDLKSEESSAQHILFISNYDSLMYQAYGKPAYFDWSNWYHAYRLEKDVTLNEISSALSQKVLDLVVLDNSPDCIAFEVNSQTFSSFMLALKANYENTGSVFGGYIYNSSSGYFERSMISIWKVVGKETRGL